MYKMCFENDQYKDKSRCKGSKLKHTKPAETIFYRAQQTTGNRSYYVGNVLGGMPHGKGTMHFNNRTSTKYLTGNWKRGEHHPVTDTKTRDKLWKVSTEGDKFKDASQFKDASLEVLQIQLMLADRKKTKKASKKQKDKKEEEAWDSRRDTECVTLKSLRRRKTTPPKKASDPGCQNKEERGNDGERYTSVERNGKWVWRETKKVEQDRKKQEKKDAEKAKKKAKDKTKNATSIAKIKAEVASKQEKVDKSFANNLSGVRPKSMRTILSVLEGRIQDHEDPKEWKEQWSILRKEMKEMYDLRPQRLIAFHTRYDKELAKQVVKGEKIVKYFDPSSIEGWDQKMDKSKLTLFQNAFVNVQRQLWKNASNKDQVKRLWKEQYKRYARVYHELFGVQPPLDAYGKEEDELLEELEYEYEKEHGGFVEDEGKNLDEYLGYDNICVRRVGEQDIITSESCDSDDDCDDGSQCKSRGLRYLYKQLIEDFEQDDEYDDDILKRRKIC